MARQGGERAAKGQGRGQGDPLGNTSRDKYSPFGRFGWLVVWLGQWLGVRVVLGWDGWLVDWLV